MRLYSYCRSSASYRVRIALALKGVRYEYVAVDISRAANAQAEHGFERVNPMRQVPVLEWRDAAQQLERLTQSVAIIEYLDERFPEPPLFAREPLARARQREAVEIVNAGTQPLQNNKTLATLRAAGGEELEARFRNEAIARGLAALELLAQRQPGPLFMATQPSIADVFIVPQLYNARRFGVPLTAHPRLVEIEHHALALGAFRAAHPDSQPDAPSTEGAAERDPPPSATGKVP
jgi:maleylpyruvate isomerase